MPVVASPDRLIVEVAAELAAGGIAPTGDALACAFRARGLDGPWTPGGMRRRIRALREAGRWPYGPGTPGPVRGPVLATDRERAIELAQDCRTTVEVARVLAEETGRAHSVARVRRWLTEAGLRRKGEKKLATQPGSREVRRQRYRVRAGWSKPERTRHRNGMRLETLVEHVRELTRDAV